MSIPSESLVRKPDDESALSTEPLLFNKYEPNLSSQRSDTINQKSFTPLDTEDSEFSPYTANNTASPVVKSGKKIIVVVLLFILSLASFVSQTELTSYLYSNYDFNQPYLLLFLTHGSWFLIWPIQVISIAIFKHFKRSRKYQYNPFSLIQLQRNISSSVKNQHKNIFKTSGTLIGENYINNSEYPRSIWGFLTSKSIIHVIKSVFIDTIILTIAGCTWYVAMGLAPASDITAIYNCSAFSALIFAIPILKEKFTYLKLSSVLLAIIGVFFVAYSGDNNDSNSEFPYRLGGDLIIAIGAILYGLYEVLYKHWVCPPMNAVSSRRQVAFSNFCASLIGISTISIVWVIIFIAHITGISKLEIPKGSFQWLIIITSILSNLIFSLSFLALMSLTSPVLSSVSSLITILFVGLCEWILFGIGLSFGQIVGDLFVVVGFTILSYSYWKEISEEDVEDDEDDDPTDIEN
ncbi:hypothetical protein WICMUC_003639 [Wickerhamomyces mucosus]|uniref:EamA domain-containing protein n=1 Tax=Wickerhamomyces mucosus TaxID=1378264 RepID=A0A9P8PK19_9ASCO|nr:hypothetical protein WICMUC_003639 [Wickerhamomyces mucosus]